MFMVFSLVNVGGPSNNAREKTGLPTLRVRTKRVGSPVRTAAPLITRRPFSIREHATAHEMSGMMVREFDMVHEFYEGYATMLDVMNETYSECTRSYNDPRIPEILASLNGLAEYHRLAKERFEAIMAGGGKHDEADLEPADKEPADQDPEPPGGPVFYPECCPDEKSICQVQIRDSRPCPQAAAGGLSYYRGVNRVLRLPSSYPQAAPVELYPGRITTDRFTICTYPRKSSSQMESDEESDDD